MLFPDHQFWDMCECFHSINSLISSITFHTLRNNSQALLSYLLLKFPPAFTFQVCQFLWCKIICILEMNCTSQPRLYWGLTLTIDQNNERKWVDYEGRHYLQRHLPQMISLHLLLWLGKEGSFRWSKWFKGIWELKIFRLVYPNDIPLLSLNVPFLS